MFIPVFASLLPPVSGRNLSPADVHIFPVNISHSSPFWRDTVRTNLYHSTLLSSSRNSVQNQAMPAAENLMFLLDYATLPEEDIKLNDTTFSWPDRILPIISYSEMRLRKKNEQVNKIITLIGIVESTVHGLHGPPPSDRSYLTEG